MSAPNKSGEKNSPKVLRIGIVQRGKIIDEREMKRRETVSVGTKDSASFTVASEALPPSFDLFEHEGGRYYLKFTADMEGRIQQSGNEVASFDSLRKAGRVVRRGDHDAVVMDDSTRGKVIIGKDVTVLFQFKTPLAAPVKPVLPADIRGSLLQNIDAQFTAIFVLVALLQISVVTYARSLPYVEPTSIDQIDDSYQKMIMPTRAPEPPKQEVAETQDKGDEPKKAEKKKEKKKAEKKPKKEQSDADKAAAARARKEAVKKKVAGKGLLKVLGANNAKGDGALANVFGEGAETMGDLGDAFSGVQGVDLADGTSEGGTRGGGDGQGVGIGDLETEGGGGGKVKTGKKTEVAVKGSASAQAPEVDGELSSAQIARVMKRQLKALRDCYERALKRDRTLKGKIIINFEILESGRTSSVDIDDQMGSRDVKRCIAGRVKYWRFPKPDGGSVFVSYPVVFAPSS